MRSESDNLKNNISRQDEVLVRVDGVSKKFCRDLKKSLWYGVKDFASELFPFQRSKRQITSANNEMRSGEFWANKDISFELRRGECLGLIGHNGAGKTTLLKMLNGLIKPDIGSIEIKGRVGALIALGAGFNPILTGKENVFIAGSVLGLSKKEIQNKYDEIVDFAGIEKFMESPVQNYSSGMQVRLGFAVASSLAPDVLIIDEVLAVGDVEFRNKCYNKIYSLAENAAVIFVSHSMPQVARLCDRAILLDHGKIIMDEKSSISIEGYHTIQSKNANPAKLECAEGVNICNIKLCGKKVEIGDYVEFDSGQEFSIAFDYAFENKYQNIELAVGILSQSGEHLAHSSSAIEGVDLQPDHKGKAEILFPHLYLGNEPKMLSIMVRNASNNQIIFWGHMILEVKSIMASHVPSPFYFPANYRLNIN